MYVQGSPRPCNSLKVLKFDTFKFKAQFDTFKFKALKSPWKVLKFSCRIFKIFGSLGPFAGIGQFVKLEVENLLPFWQLNVWEF